MSKYSGATVLKETKARAQHLCSKCGRTIGAGDLYYREHIEDRFLHTLRMRKYCAACYEAHGTALVLQKW